MIIPLGSHSVYTWAGRRWCKGFVNLLFLLFLFSIKTMEFGPSNWTMKKGHLPWSDFKVHDGNRL
jgi:hypothetical protein